MIKFVFHSNRDDSVQKLAGYLEELNKKDRDSKGVAREGKYIIEIKKHFPNRSSEQNARYWVILQHIAATCGHTTDDLHEMYKKKFNGKWVLDEQVGNSTSNLNTREFTVYMNQVEQHGKDFFGLVFLHPEDEKYLEWESQVQHAYNNLMIA